MRIPLYRHHRRPRKNRAHYDAAGNIIIGEQKKISRKKKASPLQRKTTQWEVTEEDDVVKQTRKDADISQKKDSLIHVLKGARGQMMAATSHALLEGKNQYSMSFRSLGWHLRQAMKGLTTLLIVLWGFMTQPVWVVQANKPPKEYSRLTLFTLDVVRFGGTFAAIFVVLFVSLNYQSFWQIVSPYLDPLERAQSQRGAVAQIDSALKEKLLRSPMLATAGKEEGNLLSYLPEVGPPENRIIIPRLGLNIPLVTPSFESLLEEDWDGVEEDIQAALQHGVVHYPGTARPGQAGNFFVTGHSSYYPWASGNYKTIFARLHELTVGDEYWVYYGGDKHRYVIQGKREVRPSNVSVLDQPTSKRMATLMTCTPVGTTLRRLILEAQEIDPVTGIALKPGEKETRVVQDFTPEALPI